MASLDPAKVSHLRKCIDACQEDLLLAAIPQETARSLQGVLGVLDWRVHGAISRLVKQNALSELSLFPSRRLLGKASLVLFRGSETSVSKLGDALKKLGAARICVAESSFSPSLWSKLEAQLKRAEISWTKLEELA